MGTKGHFLQPFWSFDQRAAVGSSTWEELATSKSNQHNSWRHGITGALKSANLKCGKQYFSIH